MGQIMINYRGGPHLPNSTMRGPIKSYPRYPMCCFCVLLFFSGVYHIQKKMTSEMLSPPASDSLILATTALNMFSCGKLPHNKVSQLPGTDL